MKLIVVEGAKSSGKTSSIKLACKGLGLDFTKSAVADIQCIAKFRHGGTNRLIGIGSAGDDAPTIRANLIFFKDHDLYCAICACSAPRVGMPLLEAFALLRNAEIRIIKSKKVNSTLFNAENARLAATIIDAVRG